MFTSDLHQKSGEKHIRHHFYITYIHRYIHTYIYIYIRRALCPGRVRSQLSTNKEIILLPPPLIPSPRAVLEPRVGELWLRCGIVIAQSWKFNEWRRLLEPSRALLEAARFSRRPKMPPSWLQEASRWLYVGSSWPQDDQNGLPRPPRCLKNASGRPQDELKIENFEVFVRKT